MYQFSWEALGKELLYNPENPLLFNSGFFVFFFVAFMMLYFIFRNHFRIRASILSFFSLYFFYKASGSFVILVLISATVDFLLSNALFKSQKQLHKKLYLITSIVFNLGMLFYFKYTDFFISLTNHFLEKPLNPLHILLPIGISFYTFENISYVVDVFKKEIEPEKSFINYLLFLSFFPKLVMGPIVRAKDFIPQLKKSYFVSNDYLSRGFFLIISGLFKKLIISDYITLNFVNFVYDTPNLHTGLECLLATYAYAIVIYCDFSGYSEIAIGIALWLGIEIPANFRTPYQSSSIQEFWRRWHISLSSWLRDYLYISLGGNRKGTFRTYINLFITMLLGGFWHGASWNFIIWGALHGSVLGAHKYFTSFDFYKNWHFSKSKFYTLFSAILTFHFVCFCWIFFRAETINEAQIIIRQIFFNFTLLGIEKFITNYKNVLLMMTLGYILHLIPSKFSFNEWKWVKEKPVFFYVLFFILFLIAYSQLKSAESVMPIYLQF